MSSEHDHADRKFAALYIGVVVDVEDPEKLGRVRVSVPGLIGDEGSAWAHPLWPGSGGKQRGMHSPPPKGADVGVLFEQGDIDHPFYLGGYPGRGEAPDEVKDASSLLDATKVFSFETDRWKFLFDSRPGKQLLQLKDKKTEDVVEIDGMGLGVRIKATSTIVLECTGAISITGAAVMINGRAVMPTGSPIS